MSSFVIGEKTMLALREVFELSLEKEEELGGVFVAATRADHHIELSLDRKQAGFCGNDWTGCSTEDAPFTWHSHPVLFDEDDRPDNFGSSVMLSGEDLMGLVQDSALNEHFLANKDGQNVFDVVLTIAGLLVVGAGPTIVARWGELAQVTEENKSAWMAEYGIRGGKRLAVEVVKKRVERAAWAAVENSFNFGAFKRLCGAYSSFGHDATSDSFFDALHRACPHVGYAAWNGADKRRRGPAERMQAGKRAQLSWFRSAEYLARDVWAEDEQLRCYVAGLRNLGFAAHFIPWRLSAQSFEFTPPS